MDRACMDCGTKIERADGFVLARDVPALLDRGIQPRERCWRCVPYDRPDEPAYRAEREVDDE